MANEEYKSEKTGKYVNQKYMYIDRYLVDMKKPTGQYTITYNDTEDIAMQELNGNAFKLWRYLVRWSNIKEGTAYKLAFSPADVCKHMGVDRNNVHRSLKELIEKGYVVDNGKGTMYFFECAEDSERLILELPAEGEELRNWKGEIIQFTA